MSDYPVNSIVSQVHGTGDPGILILHGWGSSPDAFAGIIASLKLYRKVITVALPGFGISPEPDRPWNTMDYVAVLKSWMDSQHLSKVDVIAHSFGGRITIGLAAKHPQMFSRIILIGSAGLIIPRSLKTRLRIMQAKLLNRISSLLGGGVRDWVERRKQRLGSSDWRSASPVMKRTMSLVINEDLSADLKKMQSPVSLIWGEQDTAVPLAIGRRMAELIPHSTFKSISDAGHYCFIDRKGETLAEIWRFLDLPAAW